MIYDPVRLLDDDRCQQGALGSLPVRDRLPRWSNEASVAEEREGEEGKTRRVWEGERCW